MYTHSCYVCATCLVGDYCNFCGTAKDDNPPSYKICGRCCYMYDGHGLSCPACSDELINISNNIICYCNTELPASINHCTNCNYIWSIRYYDKLNCRHCNEYGQYCFMCGQLNKCLMPD